MCDSENVKQPRKKMKADGYLYPFPGFILSNFLFSFYMVSEQGEAVKPGSFTRLSLIRHLTLSDRNGDKNPTAWKVTLLGVWINSLEANQSAGCSINMEVVTWLCQGSVERLAMQTADFSSSITECSFLRIISVWWVVLPSKSDITIQTIHVHQQIKTNLRAKCVIFAFPASKALI